VTEVERPVVRPRRLRATPALRRLVAETSVEPRHLVLPMFVREGITEPVPIGSMPGVVQHTRDSARRAVAEAAQAGIGGVMLFGVPERKDPLGSGACDPNGILNLAIADAVAEIGDALPVMADLCLDEFTDHGHCGVLDARGRVDNDATLALYAEMARAQADAGVHVVGPSGMMDGQVAVVRAALDDASHEDVAILAYSAKYASAFYGPFREAVASSLEGDRRTYQQDPANALEGAGGAARRRAGRRPGDGQAGPALPRRAARGARGGRRAGGGVQHLGGVLHGRGRRRARLDRPRGGDPGVADRVPPRRRGRDPELLGGRGRAAAQLFMASVTQVCS
jgi:porphobilinogen synthase